MAFKETGRNGQGSTTPFTIRPEDGQMSKLAPYTGKPVVFGARPEEINDKIFVGSAPPDRTVRATVEVIEPMGAEVFLDLNTGAHSFIARVDAHEQAEVNSKLDMVFSMKKSHFFDPTIEKVIV